MKQKVEYFLCFLTVVEMHRNHGDLISLCEKWKYLNELTCDSSKEKKVTNTIIALDV